MLHEITFGNYKGKPLVWIPIYKNNNLEYILREPICRMCFDSGISMYSDSDARKYIVEEFIPSAFSQEELDMLAPNERCLGDVAYLLQHYDIKKQKYSVNRKIFKEKHAWWVRDHIEDNNEALWGAIWRFGLAADINKKMKCGIRPCITFKN